MSYYHAYIKSEQWKAKAWAAKKRANFRCQVCNAGGRLEAHHRTYERLGNERPEDITVLCESCHKLFSDRIGKVHTSDEQTYQIADALVNSGNQESIWAKLGNILGVKT